MRKDLNLPMKPLDVYNYIRKKYKYTALLESMDAPTQLATQSIICFSPRYLLEYRKDILYRYTSKSKEREIVAVGFNNTKNYLTDILNNYDEIKPSRYFNGGLLGFTSYDIIKKIEKIHNNNQGEFPDFLYGFFSSAIIFDHQTGDIYLQSIEDDEFDIGIHKVRNFKPLISNIKFNYNEREFLDMVKDIKQRIVMGEVFQTVVSQTCTFEVQNDVISLYLSIREINPSPFMYCLEFSEYTVIGASPELLISKEENTLTTYPIAGTRKLTNNNNENRIIGYELLSDEKEMAEHNMLVDLARNDISRVSKVGSVKVVDYALIQHFSHVMHIVSKVVGKILPYRNAIDAFFAVFPAGTVSGAPKIRSMEFIEELEKYPRGPYAGAVGYFDVSGNMEHAIAIRSIFGIKNKFILQAGAGIVYDSIPEKEYTETLDKMAAFLKILIPEVII